MRKVGREQRRRVSAPSPRQFRANTLPHAAPRPVELLRPDVLWAGEHLRRKLRGADLTIVTPRRARTLYRLARSVERRGVPGAIVDCGVRNGGSAILLSEGAPSREVWAFDSFQGLPAPTAEDLDGPVLPKGAWRGSIEAVRRGFESYGRPQRLHVVEGWFEDTLRAHADQVGDVAIIHVDADYYAPVKLALETFYPLLAVGGYAIVDDYHSFPGARKATDEVRSRFAVTQSLVMEHYWRR
jgi:predicted O-methyltransferase YrrM